MACTTIEKYTVGYFEFKKKKGRSMNRNHNDRVNYIISPNFQKSVFICCNFTKYSYNFVKFCPILVQNMPLCTIVPRFLLFKILDTDTFVDLFHYYIVVIVVVVVLVVLNFIGIL